MVGDLTPPSPGRVVVTGPAAFEETAAETIAGILTAAIEARYDAYLALAGGTTPRPVYERLARRRDVPWTVVHVYFGDERAVPPDDPASNYRMARETLLGRAPIPPRQVHRMKAEEADLGKAAREYAFILPEPLDLVILGIGEDGHTASLFAGSEALDEDRRRVLPVVGPKPPPRRLTITPPVITAARETLVLASGSDKADAVARALEGSWDPHACPAQLARGGWWLLDQRAAAELDRNWGQ
jgi:6-phosphogluconolactonase